MSNRVFGPEAEIFAVLGIKGVAILTPTGLPLYERQFSNFGVDLGLVGGFTSVLSMMFDSLQEEVKQGFETLQGNEFVITMHKAKYSIALIISDSLLPKMILSQIKKSHQNIESEFEEEISDEDIMDQLPPDEIEKIFNKFKFKVFLNDNQKLDSGIMSALMEKNIDLHMKQNLELISEFAQSNAEEQFSIHDLVDFLKGEGMSEKVISTVLIFCYNKDLFVST